MRRTDWLVSLLLMVIVYPFPFSANSFTDIYIKPWCRVGPYAVGIVTGYLLHVSERNPRRLHKVPGLLSVADNKV